MAQEEQRFNYNELDCDEDPTILSQYIASRGMSVTWFAKQLGISRPHASKVIHGRWEASQELKQKIEDFTNGAVKVNDLEVNRCHICGQILRTPVKFVESRIRKPGQFPH